MADHIITLPRGAWPLIEEGRRTDRGYEHLLRLDFQTYTDTGDTVSVHIHTRRAESVVLVYIKAVKWTAPGTGWTLIQVDELLHGGQATFGRTDYDLGTVWTDLPDGDVRSLLAAQAIATPIWLSDLKTGVFSELSRLRIRLSEPGLLVPPEMIQWRLLLSLIRIPYAKPRAWTEEDMARAVEATDEISRRVT